jgi:WD40 repeat protein
MWSRRADQQIDQFWRTEGPDDPRSASYDDDCQTLAFSESGRLLFVSSTRRVPDPAPEDGVDHPGILGTDEDINTMAVYDILTADRTTDFKMQKKTGKSRITSLGVSPCGEALATAGFDGIIRLWGVNHKRSGPWKEA